MNQEMQVFEGVTNPFEFKEVIVKAQKKYVVSGYVSTKDVDLVGDQVTAECLQDMLSQIQSGSVKMDWEHETIIEEDLNKIPRARIIPDTAKVDGKGLWVEAEINPDHVDFQEIWGSIKNKFLDAFSIAFRPVEAVIQWAGDRAIRILNKIKLINVGITGNPVNEEAKMDSVIVKALSALGSGLLTPPNKEEPEEDEEEDKKEPVEKKALTYEGQQIYAGEKSNMDMVAGKFSKTYDIEKDLVYEGMKEEVVQLDAVNNDMDTIAKMVCNRLKADPEHYKKLKAVENHESYSNEVDSVEKSHEEAKGDTGTKTMEGDKKQYSEEEKMKMKQDKEDYKSDIATLKSDISELKSAVEELKMGSHKKMEKEDMKNDEESKGKNYVEPMGKQYDDEYGKKEYDKKSMMSEIKSLKDAVENLASKPVMKSMVSEVPTKLNENELPEVLGLIQ